MDKLVFSGMQFYGYHGVFAEESRLGQPFLVDVEAGLDLRRAGRSDRLEDTVDYGLLYQLTEEVMTVKKYRLIEAAAEEIAAQILAAFQLVQWVKVRVTKTKPPIPGQYAGVSVEIERSR